MGATERELEYEVSELVVVVKELEKEGNEPLVLGNGLVDKENECGVVKIGQREEDGELE